MAQYDVFIAYARPDAFLARALYVALRTVGLRVFFDEESLRVGTRFMREIPAALASSTLVVVLVSAKVPEYWYLDDEVARTIAQARAEGARIVPVLLDDSAMPYGLQGIVPIRSCDIPAITAILHSLLGGSEAVYSRALHALTQRFLSDARQASGSLKGVTFVAENTPATRTDVRALEVILEPGERGYFAFEGGLTDEVRGRLDRLRVHNNPVVPLSEATMKAALRDGNASSVLRGLERLYFDQQNLFRARNALTDPRFFFGHSQRLTRIGSALAAGENVLITGLRKVGKSSFLNILRGHLIEHPWCAIDLQQYDPESSDWPADLFRRIVDAFDRWGQQELEDWPGAPASITTGAELADALARRRDWQRARGRDERLVLVLDEAERVFPREGEQVRARRYVHAAGALRALAQSGGDRPLSILAADLRPVLNRKNLLPGGDTNPFFQLFQELPLPMLNTTELDDLVRSIGRMMGIRKVEPNFISELHSFTGGHPALARLIAAAACELRQDEEALCVADLEAGLDQLAETWQVEDFFEENLWLPLSAAEQKILHTLITQPGHVPSRWERRLRAGLRSQGYIVGNSISIGGFAEWLRGELEAPGQTG